nr:3084_t:CDS:2 [Entrophospora candida]
MSASMRRMRVIDKWKLDHKESAKLSRFLDGIQYTCGNSFKGLTSEVQQDEFSELFLKICFVCGEQCEQENMLNLSTDNEFYYYYSSPNSQKSKEMLILFEGRSRK